MRASLGCVTAHAVITMFSSRQSPTGHARDSPAFPCVTTVHPARRGNQQRIGAERFRDIGIPGAFAAHIDAFRPNMSGSLTGGHKSKMARIPRRIVDDAMVVHIQREQSGRHDLRGDNDVLHRLRRRTMLEFERHIANQGFRAGRFLHECNVVDLERGGERETNRSVLLRHLKGQPVLCDERMMLGDDLYE